ncbi:major facilitator superfamily MFS_1 [Xylanimonas cellulosilytica DSM 15894]|uniref:Putative proline/betaine transporter n=1 Tax=Xylanimonas cellulosilytica (strain DSM 15894 / JCM 12276 / CECT 5975 / KCTC 9989 / LMG 20990 / NBRC 107835 / XIL07) TaxID=446471 RepID=D1BVJ4_XYLCX|nr:MFS transporter [Xylanimonas cellulosilytica]ACZ31313.1 major facilitator superfamily MFS_1 [Xylanimonas cellulosilytica DSM 15894]
MSVTVTSPAPGVTAENTRGRVVVASMIGTSIEFYDFYVYATAAVLVFPELFFPNAQDPTTQLLSSFAVFGVAFVARPLGSILFGHFGDKVGRKTTLVASLLTMGIATVLIGVIPPAATPGWSVLAPAALVLCRFAQGLGLGGEWSGAALLATENAPEGKRAIWGTFPQLGAPIGFILANVVFITLSTTVSPEAFTSWGWRVPFLASAALVVIGLWVRLKLIETPAFRKVQEADAVVTVPLARVFRTAWTKLISGTFIMLATYVLFYLMTTFTLTFGTAAVEPEQGPAGLGYERVDFLWMLIIGVVFFGVFTLVSGPLAERFGRRKHLIAVTVAIIVFGGLFVPLFAGGTVGVQALLILGFSLMGLTFGPMAAVLPELFAANVRYTGSAIAYNVSSILGAAVAPFIAVWLWSKADGSPVLVGLYLSAMAVITLVALLLEKETRHVDYNGHIAD